MAKNRASNWGFWGPVI